MSELKIDAECLERFGSLEFDVMPSPLGGFVYVAKVSSPDRQSESIREGTVKNVREAYVEIYAWLKEFADDDVRFDAKQWDDLADNGKEEGEEG